MVIELVPVISSIPIGDNFTMGISDSLKAVEFLKPRIMILMHYNTFEVIKQDPKQFIDGLRDSHTKGYTIADWGKYRYLDRDKDRAI